MSLAEAEEVQRRRRRRRAEEGGFKVSRLSDAGIEARYAVRSKSGNTYEVEVLSAAEALAACTCPDYRTNTLLACKHTEATFLHLRQAEPAALREAAGRQPPEARVHLRRGEQLEVRLLRGAGPPAPLAAHLDLYFDPEGRFKGELWRDFGGFTRGAAALGGVHVDPEVHAHARAQRQETRREALLREARDRVLEGEELGVTRGALRPYQRLGALHLAFRERAILADDLGLGKTAQAIAGAELLRRDQGIRRILVVCPAAQVAHWVAEVSRLTGEVAARARGTPDQRRQVYSREASYTVVPEEMFPSDSEDLVRLRPELLILDAAQRIRDWRSRTAEEVKRLATRFAFLLVDGPPLADLDHLYSVVQMVDQRRLGPLWRFNPRYFVLGSDGTVHGSKNLRELEDRIAPLLLRRSWGEVAGDTPRAATVLRIPPSFKAWAEGETQREALRQRKRRTGRFGAQLAALRRAWDEVDSEHAPKLTELVALVSESLPGEETPVGVVACSEALLAAAGTALDAAEVPWRRVGGKQTPGARVELALDSEAGGLALPPSAALIELDVPWSPEDLDRRRRLPADRRIQLLTEGTVEERLFELHREAPEAMQALGLAGPGDAPTLALPGEEDAWQALLAPPGSPPPRRPREESPGPPPSAAHQEARPPAPRAEHALRHQATLFDGPQASEAPAPGPPAQDLAALLRPVLGDKLIGVEPLGTGEVVVVQKDADRLRGTIRALSRGAGVRPVVLDSETYAQLAELVPAGAPPAPVPDSGQARAALEASRTKVEAAAALLEAHMPHEAVAPALRAMEAAALAMLLGAGAPAAQGPELVPAVYRHLVQGGHLDAELASCLGRARDLATLAQEGNGRLVDAPLARAVLADARRLLEAATLGSE